MISIRKISPRDESVQRFIKALDDYFLELYPSESNHLDSADELSKDNVYFVGAFENDKLLGCGAAKIINGEYAEIKRVYVEPSARGKKIGDAIMQSLEAHLVESKIFTAYLETGIYQESAIALYRRLGYEQTGPFGPYQEDAYSFFMKKTLT